MYFPITVFFMLIKKTTLKLLPITLALAAAIAVTALIINSRPQNAMPEMKMPYIAMNMALRTQVIITNDHDYLKWLEVESGMNRKKIKELFKYLSENTTTNEIRKNVRDEIHKSLGELEDLPSDKKLDFFVINILAPYLSMSVNDFAVNIADEKEIRSVFAELFDVPPNKANPLAELAEGAFRYHYGGISSAKYIYEVNYYLRNKGFYLDYNLRRSYSNIFKIDRVVCADEEWRDGEKISVFVLKRIYPNILSSKLGFAQAAHSSVVVVKDLIDYIAKEYKGERGKKTPRVAYLDTDYQILWKSLGLNIDHIRANRLRYELAYRDLQNSPLPEIEKNLTIQIAIHEAKHRVDEIEMPDMRLNLDLEISAYLAAAITGPYPFLGLRDIIEWTEGYYRGTKSAKLRTLLGELWTLADKSLNQNYTEERLRSELRKIYENYRTIYEDMPLIDLTEFERRMAGVIRTKIE
jgi:hypothetical protein